MILFKLVLFYLFLVDSNAKQDVALKTGGHWKRVLVDELPETDKELQFSQLKNLSKFDLKLVENPFKHINLGERKGSDEEQHHHQQQNVTPYRLMLLNLVFWSKFNETQYPNLFLELNICDDQFSWPMKNKERKVVFKQFDEAYIQSKYELGKEPCLSDFKFSIINSSNESSNESATLDFEIKELNILHLGVYYSSVEFDLPSTGEINFDDLWNKVEEKYELAYENASSPHRPVKLRKYECKLEDCRSFSINQKEIENRMYYPKIDKDWESFFESRRTDEIFSLQLNRDLKLIANYTVEFLYFVTRDVQLDVYTSLNNNSIVSLYPTYSYLPDNETFKWLPIVINLKDILPFKVNSVRSGFTIYIRTTIKSGDQHLNRSLGEHQFINSKHQLKSIRGKLQMAAITGIQLNSGDYVRKPNLTDYLADWNSNGRRALNEWTCLVDQTTFYDGKLNDQLNNITVIFFAPRLKSTSTYLLLSKWLIATNQKFEIKIINELNSRLQIDTLNEDLEVLNSRSYVLDQQDENQSISYDVLNGEATLERSAEQQVVRLRLSFRLMNYDDEDRPKRVVISGVNMADPCSDPNLCIFSEKCNSKSSTEFDCICLDGYHGKRCEFPDECARMSSTAVNENCQNQNATCVPIRDSYKCDCSNHQFWLNDFKKCRDPPICYTEPGLMENQCVYEHDYDYDPNFNYTFGCNRIFEVNSYVNSCDELKICGANDCTPLKEKCIPDLLSGALKNRLSICDCDLDRGYIRNGRSECVQLTSDQTAIPFVSAKLNCPYDYRIVERNLYDALTNTTKVHSRNSTRSKQSYSEFECSCPNGFELSTNATDQSVSCRPKSECNLECAANQFCGFDENNKTACLCELGFYGPNCTMNYCDDKQNDEITAFFCGDLGCNVTSNGFICNCDERIYELDNSTGLCRFKDICAPNSRNDEICKTFNAICMPYMDESALSFRCRCPQGWREDPITKKCSELCTFYNYSDLTNQRCFPNLTLKEPKFLCKPGLVLRDNVCVLSEIENKYELRFEARINANEDMDRKFNQFKNDDHSLTNVNCNHYLDREGCVRLLNRSFLQLEEMSVHLLINESYIYSMSNLVSLSLQSMLGDDLFSAQILKFSKIAYIDQANRTAKPDDTARYREKSNREKIDYRNFYRKPYSQLLHFSVYLETNGFFENLDENFFIGDCSSNFCPVYPYLHLRRGTMKIKKMILNESDLLLQCYPGSSPIFTGNSNSLFRCSCNSGHRELARIPLSSDENYFKAICYDIDECLESGHMCNLNTTNCVNLVGSYRCDCKNDGMIRQDAFNCEEVVNTQQCNLTTTDFVQIDRQYECRCKNASLVRLDKYNCFDPCLNATCEQGRCLPYFISSFNSSYVCVYTDRSSSHRPSIFLLVWTCLFAVQFLKLSYSIN